MKRYISLLIIISSLLGLTGCGGIHTNYREIQQLLVVQTLGLDREEGSVRVSMMRGSILLVWVRRSVLLSSSR